MVKTEIRVIYGDTDQAGVVYHANFLRFFEAARSDYLRAHGRRYTDIERQLQIRLPVVEAHTIFKQPAFYEDLLMVQTTVTKVGRASVRFEYRVLRDDVLLVTGYTVHACIDFEGRVRSLPPAVVELLRVAEPHLSRGEPG